MHEFINDIINKKILSEYSHSNYIDKFDGRDFLHLDCSGFVFWWLAKNKYIRALAEIRGFLRQRKYIKINRFYCRDFHEMFHSRNDFSYWEFMNEPHENDIIVVVFDSGNGHCMFINRVIQQTQNHLVLNITDSTRYPHKNDSRHTPETGIGTGDITIEYSNGQTIYDAGNKKLKPKKCNVYFIHPKR